MAASGERGRARARVAAARSPLLPAGLRSARAGGARLSARQGARAVPPLRRRRALPHPRVSSFETAGQQIAVHAARLAGGQPRPRRG